MRQQRKKNSCATANEKKAGFIQRPTTFFSLRTPEIATLYGQFVPLGKKRKKKTTKKKKRRRRRRRRKEEIKKKKKMADSHPIFY